jgi:2-keto-4-pentenoate hydratase/2-oxohepta-3-ene-1,7-dioic acid hydratase in catechol pathway|tara:strand:- start:1118 stop:1975 length:858 start_codon:yes stop_codon:yes gene_type:complete
VKICRYDNDRLGLVLGDEARDVTAALAVLPSVSWPVPLGDLMIANLGAIMTAVEKLISEAPVKEISDVQLRSPVANPSKIIGAPINYQTHIDESIIDDGIVSQRKISHISDWGLFLKANTSLVGPGDGVAVQFIEARNDHEVELAVVIGKACTHVSGENALDYVAGYAIGLDMTTRGKELQSFRKSSDSYAVIGPWLVTADEINDPNNLDLRISVNGEVRQDSNTRDLVYDVGRLIEYASERYTLLPGDIIMTGTPDGVGPVEPGDVMTAEIENIGVMEVAVRAA